MIGHTNTALKRVGVSKHRMMAGGSVYCAICEKRLERPPDHNHKCVEHEDWQLIVVDSELSGHYGRLLLLGRDEEAEAEMARLRDGR